MTDDDCEVPEDWLQRLVDVSDRNQRVGMVFGNVVPGRFDASRGFVPTYVRSEPFLCRGDRREESHRGDGGLHGLAPVAVDAVGRVRRDTGRQPPLRGSRGERLRVARAAERI